MRPLNHGLTVWRSEEATSIGCGAISARTWLATTMSAVGVGLVGTQREPGRTAAEEYARARPRPRARAKMDAKPPAGLTPQAERASIRRASLGGGASARQPLANGAPQRLHASRSAASAGIAGELPLDLERMGRIELAVEIGVNEQARIRRRSRHDTPPGASVPMRAISRRRARASRDITVPIGTLVTSAISR